MPGCVLTSSISLLPLSRLWGKRTARIGLVRLTKPNGVDRGAGRPIGPDGGAARAGVNARAAVRVMLCVIL
jgi:hypothetical protein